MRVVVTIVRFETSRSPCVATPLMKRGGDSRNSYPARTLVPVRLSPIPVVIRWRYTLIP